MSISLKMCIPKQQSHVNPVPLQCQQLIETVFGTFLQTGRAGYDGQIRTNTRHVAQIMEAHTLHS
jgi:hypothetical protein